MNGTSHPGSTANGGFRRTANGEQYAFKVINIEGICQSHLYVPNFLLPAGGAMNYNWILACRCVQASTFIKHMKFGADRTLHV